MRAHAAPNARHHHQTLRFVRVGVPHTGPIAKTEAHQPKRSNEVVTRCEASVSCISCGGECGTSEEASCCSRSSLELCHRVCGCPLVLLSTVIASRHHVLAAPHYASASNIVEGSRPGLPSWTRISVQIKRCCLVVACLQMHIPYRAVFLLSMCSTTTSPLHLDVRWRRDHVRDGEDVVSVDTASAQYTGLMSFWGSSSVSVGFRVTSQPIQSGHIFAPLSRMQHSRDLRHWGLHG